MEFFSHKTTKKWVQAHSERLSNQGNELAIYFKNQFNPNNPDMEITNQSVDAQIEKLRTDNTLSEKSRARRIETWESLRPDSAKDEPRIGAGIEADVKAWSNGTLGAQGQKPTSEKGGSDKTAADIEKWSASFNQNNK